jgi:peptidyl-prolyl cis-trans isomerase A (cyclophilin A)
MKTLSITIFSLLFYFNVCAQTVNITTSLGDIVVELESKKAPVTVANFLKYVEGGYYKNALFFRTVHSTNQPNSPVKITVIQGGAAEDKPRFEPIPLERTNKTGLKHKNGTISMARSEPDTAQDSFFICIDDQPELDFGGKRNPDGQGFAAFGQVIKGMDVVRKINQSPSDGQSIKPSVLIKDIVILK